MQQQAFTVMDMSNNLKLIQPLQHQLPFQIFLDQFQYIPKNVLYNTGKVHTM
jgi:hypothetical protein